MNASRSVVCAIAASLCLAAIGTAQEQGVKSKDVPAAVAAAAKQLYPNARIVGWSKETDAGKTFYEAEMREGQTKRDVQFLPDGKIDVVEEEIAIAAVPVAVRDALKARYPKAVIGLAERLTRGSDVQYELQLKKAPKKEIVFTPDGKFVKEE
ncbi:MAG TPA: PepSY-like domain-containing protein [Terriglobia bacterium]|nr:PepSY-like domain-containing protein [Terriglobia bacterium]